jgi:hypothetical protein
MVHQVHVSDTIGATVIIMAMTFGPGVAWLLWSCWGSRDDHRPG